MTEEPDVLTNGLESDNSSAPSLETPPAESPGASDSENAPDGDRTDGDDANVSDGDDTNVSEGDTETSEEPEVSDGSEAVGDSERGDEAEDGDSEGQDADGGDTEGEDDVASKASDRRLAIAIGVITLVAFALRIADVGARPLHHDESLDAWWSWRVLEGTFDGYDPVYHGPLRFYITATFFWFFGETVAVARLFSVLSGTLLVATPYFLRRQIGRVGALSAAVLLTISPSMLYYSRFGREDIQVLLLTAVMLVGTIAYFRKPRPWLPVVVAAALASSLAIKESTYLLIYVVVAFFFVALAVEYARLTTEDDDPLTDLLVPLGAVGGLFFALFVAYVSGHTFVALTVYLVALAGMALWFFVAARRSNFAATDAPTVARFAAVGWVPWFVALVVFVALFEVFFTFFFTQPENWTAGVTDAIEYWQSQQEVNRGSQPWYYYLILMPAYEWLILLFAGVGIVVAARRRTFSLALISWLAISSLMIYSYAGERMPWLVIHPLYPALLLAALGVDYAWRNRNEIAPRMALVFLAFGLVITSWSALRFSFANGSDSREILVQGAQATPHVTAIVDYLEDLDAVTRTELGRPLTVGISADNSWPWAFYLRDLEGRTFVRAPDLSDSDVLLPDMGYTDADGMPQTLDPADYPDYNAVPVSMRSWWVPAWVPVGEGEDAGQGVGGYFNGGASGWARWLYDREIWSYDGCGSHDQYFMVKKDIEALAQQAEDYGVLEPLELEPIACASPRFREAS